MKTLRSISTALALVTSLFLRAETFDGPYVMPRADSGWETWSVVVGDAGLSKRVEPVGADGVITVEATDGRPAFRVLLRGTAPIESERINDVPGRVFLMADSHGQFEVCTELLIKHGVIDADLNWSFGTNRLVVLGDIFDRGPRHLEILWFLYKLEAEAEAAGGRVQVILGNHEAMIMTGDIRYLNSRYVQVVGALGLNTYADLLRKDSLLGQWLRSKPTVIRLGDILCLHGGMSVGAVDQKISIEEINQTVRDWLNDERSRDSGRLAFITGRNGPLWYGGLTNREGYREATSEEVETIRKFYGVERIAVGHTIVPTVTSLYNGSVIAVQVYPTKDKTTGKMNMEGVYIDEHGTWHKAKIDGTREPLKDDKGEVIRNSPPPEPAKKAA